MLTDVKVRTAKPDAKNKKLYDELGLFLLIKPSGSKLWRLKYQFSGKEKLLAIGAYPDVSLQQARKARSELREQLLQGIVILPTFSGQSPKRLVLPQMQPG